MVLAVVWGDAAIVIRFSIVPAEVPFLISEFVFKRFGAALDLDANELFLQRFGSDQKRAVEPLFNLMSGHVAVS